LPAITTPPLAVSVAVSCFGGSYRRAAAHAEAAGPSVGVVAASVGVVAA